MIFHAVIDTNILVSGLLSANDNAATVQVIRKLITGEIIPVYSKEIIKEYKDVLGRKKFGFSKETVNYMLSAIDKYGILVEAPPANIILPDKKDLPFLEAAIAQQHIYTYLITGNLKHFPKESFIITARQMINILNNNHSIDF